MALLTTTSSCPNGTNRSRYDGSEVPALDVGDWVEAGGDLANGEQGEVIRAFYPDNDALCEPWDVPEKGRNPDQAFPQVSVKFAGHTVHYNGDDLVAGKLKIASRPPQDMGDWLDRVEINGASVFSRMSGVERDALSPHFRTPVHCQIVLTDGDNQWTVPLTR